MKISLKVISVLSTVIISSNAFAISDDALADKCLQTGKNKIAEQAASWKCNVDLNRVEIQEIDNRFYNPSKYVWYEVKGECNGYSSIIKLVQYNKGKCF